ncbi:hypothetical protein HPB52_002728 [Rhipicephalus sanguineus]|uniref:Uncharacterized protein n=1 Tax=Rhipicephalus sanguineus TaxID=34632 RepID=A0A9D4SRV9_RHISA|nr:hypothetical protein HPB52_002728 [Rhipicephalus sanguineus]
MGERLTSVHEFPPDKVCDYIFYDSLYKEGNHNLLPDQTTYTESLNAFINNHPGYRRTTLGIGFAFDEVSFTPHLVISIGHYRHGDDKPSTCTIVPPTRHPDDVPPQDILLNYGFDVSTPMYQLRYLYSQGTATIGVVSVTLKGSWTHPLSSANVSFYDPCSPEAIPSGSYTEVCPIVGDRLVAHLNYSTKHHAMITYIASMERTFTYDNEKAFAEKLCRVKALGTDVPFGIAVYGVDYDDYDDKCGTLNTFGAYSRLKALRNLVDYFKETAPFNETACRTFVKG